MVAIEIHSSGPLFDGRAQAAVTDYLDDAKWTVGGQGLANVQHILDVSIRNPTPYYEAQVTVQRIASDVVVHDRDIVYGRWLEGVSERNKTTSFKGYHAFRKAHQALVVRAPQLSHHVLQQYLPRMR